jgi:hypothetical protein
VPLQSNSSGLNIDNPDRVEIEVITTETRAQEGIYTRTTDPFKPEWVAVILASVKIGDDLTAWQRSKVELVISKYADCFTLSVSEVTVVEDAVHQLNIPEGTKFNLKKGYRQLSPLLSSSS